MLRIQLYETYMQCITIIYVYYLCTQRYEISGLKKSLKKGKNTLSVPRYVMYMSPLVHILYII